MADLIFPLKKDVSRQILHVDMDAFYASIEMRDHPQWHNKPVVIAKHPKENFGHGVVATANYKAREYGIHSAMSAAEAYRLCPEAIFCPPRHGYYKEVSQEVHRIFQRYTSLIEPVALDEAYLDVTQHPWRPRKIAYHIQQTIYQELHLTCSVGLSYNKFLAKLASDYQKPSGITVILPSQAEAFLADLPIEDFKGVGKKTLPIMKELGIHRGADLRQLSEMDLIHHFGKRGYDLYRKVRGIHDEPVRPYRPRQSLGCERTYHPALVDEEQLYAVLKEDSITIAEQLAKKELYAKVITLKWRYCNYETKSKQRQLSTYTSQADVILHEAKALWEEVDDFKDGLRLVGITVSQLTDKKTEQLLLF